MSYQNTTKMGLNTSDTIKRILKEYLKPYWGKVLIAVFFMVITAAMTALFAHLLQPVFDDVLINKKEDLIFTVAGFLFACLAMRGISAYFHTIIMSSVGQSIIADIQNQLFNHVSRLDLTFYQEHSSGQLISRLTSDVNVMRGAVAESFTGIGKSLLTLIFLIIVMFMQDVTLSIAAFVIFPIAAWFVAIIGRKIRKVSGKTQTSMADFSDRMNQVFQGIRQVQVYNKEQFEADRLFGVINDVKNFNIKAIKLGHLSTPVNDVLVGIILFGLVAYGGSQVLSDQLTPGSLVSFIAAFLLAYEPMKKLAKLYANIQLGLGAADRVFNILDTKSKITDKNNAKTLKSKKPHIKFENASFSYNSDEGNAIEDISIDIEFGKTIALVGPSGGGKSTLLNLIPRFYDVQKGVISIDGHDLKDLSLMSLRNHIALVSQEIVIFDDTIYQNIAYGANSETVKEADIIKAAELAHADEFINVLPDKYETRLGEHGLRLSGGQRQRIAIARAILKDAPILLLDEATSALDNESERFIQESLNMLRANRTCVMIAHRLSTILSADHILVIDKGRIVEQGTHEALLSEGGLYAGLYKHALQSGEESA